MNLLILQAMDLIAPLLFFHKDGFGIKKKSLQDWYAIKKTNKLNQFFYAILIICTQQLWMNISLSAIFLRIFSKSSLIVLLVAVAGFVLSVVLLEVAFLSVFIFRSKFCVKQSFIIYRKITKQMNWRKTMRTFTAIIVSQKSSKNERLKEEKKKNKIIIMKKLLKYL